ncbi:unnamed protein product, partial [marine sediment metagenome]
MTKFIKYLLSWKFSDDGNQQASFFWLPEGVDPDVVMSDIINIVELSASEYGYEYTLDKTEDLQICPKCNKKTVKVTVNTYEDQVGEIVQVNCRAC